MVVHGDIRLPPPNLNDVRTLDRVRGLPTQEDASEYPEGCIGGRTKCTGDAMALGFLLVYRAGGIITTSGACQRPISYVR